MNSKESVFNAIWIGLILLISVCPFPCGVFNASQTSTMFSVSMLSVLFGGVVFVQTLKTKKRWFTAFDILLGIIFGINLYYLFTKPSLWNTACVSLSLLYASIRCIKKISFPTLYIVLLSNITLLSAWGYLQYFEILPSESKAFPLTGPYHNPAIWGGMLSLFFVPAVVAPILMPMLFKTLWIRCIIVLTTLFSLPPLLLSQSRTAWLAIVCSVGYVCIKRLGKRSYDRKIVIGTALLLLFPIGYILYMIKPNSVDGRLLIWKVSSEMVRDRWTTGFGRDGFAAHYLYYQADYLEKQPSDSEKILAGNTHLAFNELLRLTIEYGIVGGIIGLTGIALLFVPRGRIGRLSDTLRSTLFCGLILGMFTYPGQTFPILTVLVVVLALFVNKNYPIRIRCPPNRSLLYLCVSLSIFLSTFAGYQTIMYYRSYRSFNQFLHQRRLSVSGFKAFDSRMNKDIGFLHLYISAGVKEKDSIDLKELIERMEKSFPSPSLFILKGDYWQYKREFDLAEQAYLLAAQMVPSLQKARAHLAVLYLQTGRRDEAVQLARQILNERVKVYDFETYKLHQTLKKLFKELL